ncbi:MAG: aminotransferase class III-fold pyridoxal phosphate-dependent enzyme [Proteobacteria bacterium]|nr:aminotransferase class III-fold pyridoxal phosphate-dependent enzyme [Pseudomonadota bacterium]
MASDFENLLTRRQKLLGTTYQLFYDDPVHIVRGEGVWLYDASGRKYLDMYNNVPHVGHCHPHVVDAICEQARTLNTHTRYLHENILDYAERLVDKFPAALDTAIFCCTGSEASELALRIARTATGGTGVIVTDFAYHGNSQACDDIDSEENRLDALPDHVATVPTPDCYRGEHRGEDAGERYAEYIRDALELLDSRGIKPAAFIVDTIMSSGGVMVPPPAYLSTAAAIVREAGALFIADEVQPGFGRMGKHFWGFEVDEFVPDIVTLGKPMGNGHPIAGVVVRRELLAGLAKSSGYFNTFGGNPVSCAAASAVLDVIEDEGLQQNALEVGQHLVDGLWKLAEKHECIGDVRGTGLFLGLELVSDRERRTPAIELTSMVVNDLRNRGVLTGTTGTHDNLVKLRSPMVLSRDDADYMLGILDESLGHVTL